MRIVVRHAATRDARAAARLPAAAAVRLVDIEVNTAPVAQRRLRTAALNAGPRYALRESAAGRTARLIATTAVGRRGLRVDTGTPAQGESRIARLAASGAAAHRCAVSGRRYRATGSAASRAVHGRCQQVHAGAAASLRFRRAARRDAAEGFRTPLPSRAAAATTPAMSSGNQRHFAAIARVAVAVAPTHVAAVLAAPRNALLRRVRAIQTHR